jgi:hypothetical protein
VRYQVDDRDSLTISLRFPRELGRTLHERIDPTITKEFGNYTETGVAPTTSAPTCQAALTLLLGNHLTGHSEIIGE